MEFSLLGPIAVTTGSTELSLGPAKRRSVLALLLLQPNTTVPLEQLIDSLWEDEPPEHARTVVQGHVSRLRATLAEGGAEAYGIELTTHGSAYLLRLPEELIDAHRFGELVALARPEAAPADAVPLLREALGLWRGPALTGTVTSPPFAAAAHALEERRLTAVEALGRAHGTLGEHEQAAAILYSAAVNHPLREGLIAGLMRALFRTGRQSDALEWFHRTRRLLNEELGVDPGERLRGAYEEILRAEAADGDGRSRRAGRGPAPLPVAPPPGTVAARLLKADVPRRRAMGRDPLRPPPDRDPYRTAPVPRTPAVATRQAATGRGRARRTAPVPGPARRGPVRHHGCCPVPRPASWVGTKNSPR